jgi:transcriptional regulator with XRE-family HTH domain
MSESLLGTYLRDRRAKLDPAAFGFAPGRRRLNGLRREDVAQRANISPTWYTWLEQGRGGAPSADVLERLSGALMLTEAEREHLFLLGLGRPPEVRYRKDRGVTPRLQRVLDALNPAPAILKTATWDVIAWNRSATTILHDYAALAPDQRNMLRHVFLNPRAREVHAEWASVARSVVASFRADAVRAGAMAEVEAMIDELCRLSPDFADMWRDNDVRGTEEVVKHIRHPRLGPISVEISSFAVDGRADLSLLVFTPATPADAEIISAAMAAD